MKKQKLSKKAIKKAMLKVFNKYYNLSSIDSCENNFKACLNDLKSQFPYIHSDFQIVVYDENYISVDLRIGDMKFNITAKRIYD